MLCSKVFFRIASATLILSLISLGFAAAPATLGPEKGYLVIVGGGALTPEIKQRFVALAGGADANFVVIPTAGGDQQINLETLQARFSKNFGVSKVTVLHTRDPKRANEDAFV